MLLSDVDFQNTLLKSRLKYELDHLQEKHGFPGITCAYVLSDGTFGEVASGFADREAKEPMTPRSRMLAASVGKTFVAATVLALANAGQLNLDDPLSLWLSKCDWYSHLPNHETIRIRHLLTHSAGIPNHVHTKKFLQLLSHREFRFVPESLLSCIFDQSPLFEAGKGWAYTDSGYILLGLVIEVATGKTYYRELEQWFLGPLKLHCTTPSDHLLLPGLVPGYTALDNPFGLPRKTVDKTGALVWNPAVEWTGGGLISNSRDLAVWAKVLYEGHAMQSEYLVELLQSVSMNEGESKGRYGAGCVIFSNTPLGEQWGHLGIIPGYTSSMRYYPEHEVAIVFQINTDESVSGIINDMEQSLAAIVTGGSFEISRSENPPAPPCRKSSIT